MTYTRAVIKEILRWRPAAPMVPQYAMKDIKLENYTVPKGTLVIPSLVAACMEGFPEPTKFDPERMMPER
jgi:cytochrome P450 family 710 subfamily A protein